IRRVLDQATHQALDAKRQALAALSDRNQELSSVSSTIAHELKNPLTSIQALAQLAANGTGPGTKEHERLGVMLGEIGRMRTVLDAFRNFSRPLSELHLTPPRCLR